MWYITHSDTNHTNRQFPPRQYTIYKETTPLHYASYKETAESILLTREETSKMLSVSLVTLWDWTRKDIIPAYRIGNKVRYKKHEVLQALQKMNKFNP